MHPPRATRISPTLTVALLALARYTVTQLTLGVGGQDMLKDLTLVVAVMPVAQMVPTNGPGVGLTATVKSFA